MKLATGLVRPTAGRIAVDGAVVEGPSRLPAWPSRTPTCCPGGPSGQCPAAAGDRRAAPPAFPQEQGGIRRARGQAARPGRARRFRRALSLGAFGRHAAADLALPGAHPRARPADAGRALRGPRRLHPRGALVRAARPVGADRLHRGSRHARSQGSRVPCRHGPCDERAAGPDRRLARHRPAAPAGARYLLRGGVRRYRPRSARPHFGVRQ